MTEKINAILSVDIEATGNSPCTSSCVMIGCALVKDFGGKFDPDPNKQAEWLLEKKAWCIKEQSNRPPEKRCWEQFWLNNMNVWKHVQDHAISPNEAMLQFHEWYRSIIEKYNIKVVCKPSSYDWQWINCLYDEFGPENKLTLPFSCLCLSTMYRMLEFIGCKRSFITKLTSHENFKHTHLSDDDALEQAYAYLKMSYFIKHNVKLT
jgi:hypothetical protein